MPGVRCGEKKHIMAKVTVRKKICIPMIGTWEWSKDDYDTPLVFHLPGAKALLYLERMWSPGSRQREVTWEAILEFHIDPASRDLISGLTTSGKQALEVACQIHERYLT